MTQPQRRNRLEATACPDWLCFVKQAIAGVIGFVSQKDVDPPLVPTNWLPFATLQISGLIAKVWLRFAKRAIGAQSASLSKNIVIGARHQFGSVSHKGTIVPSHSSNLASFRKLSPIRPSRLTQLGSFCKTSPALALALLACSAAQCETPTFARDIAPIIYAKCAACHHAGGAGPFPLLSYDDAKKHARQIAAVTASGFMPPWPPQKGYGDFRDERSLTREQIQLIADWVKAGAPEGDPSNLPKPPTYQGVWQLGQPDLILKSQRGFTVPAGGPDVFWNFVFKPELKTSAQGDCGPLCALRETSAQGDCGPLCALSKTRYVRALEIRPNGSAGGRNVHHANLLIDRMGSLVRQKADLQNGFPGMDLIISENPFDPASHLLFWSAGTMPAPEPENMPWRLDPGNLLVLNTHMQPSGKPEVVQPEIGLYFTDKPPTRFPLIIEMEDDDALNIPPGAKNFVVSDDFQVPVDTEILAIRPHAHYLGKVLEAYATLPDKTRKWLIRIPDWNPDWQETYRYKQPVFLPAASVISMRYSYDNSAENPRNPNYPPKRVQTGNRATDEMSHLWLQVLPVGAGDRRRALQEALARHKLARHPDDFSAQLNLGAILMSRLDMQGAVSALKQAVHIDPKRPEAHDMLGSAMLSLGFGGEAKQQFELALAADPDYINARYNLARVLARERKFDEAAAQFERVARAFPDSARIQDEYGVLLAHSGRRAEALKQFDAALAIDPKYDDARKNRDELTRQSASRPQ